MTGPLVAIDLGTQSLRVTLLSLSGTVMWQWSRPVSSTVEGSTFTQDPQQWEALLLAGLSAAAQETRSPAAVIACGPLAGYVPMDGADLALSEALTYADRRPALYVTEVASAVESSAGADPLMLRAYGADPLPQALFMRKHADRMHHLLDATGYLNFLLTGRRTMNNYTGLRLYTPAVLDRLGIPASAFGEIVPTGQRIGTLTPQHSARLGWPEVPVIAAPFDSKCAYLASGLFAPGDMADISGTVTSLGVFSAIAVSDPQRRIYSVPFGPGWLVRGSTGMAGGILEWARRQLGFADFDAFDASVAAAPPGAGGVIFLPYLAGERAPIWKPEARGAFLGLTMDTSRNHLARSVYEGLAFAVRHIVETVRSLGVVPTNVVASGGLARNQLLLQIKADVLGLRYVPTVDHELTTSGLAAIAAATLESAEIATTARRFVDRQPPVVPNRGLGQVYHSGYESYIEAVDALLPSFGT